MLNFVPPAFILLHANLTTHSAGPQGTESGPSTVAIKAVAWCLQPQSVDWPLLSGWEGWAGPHLLGQNIGVVFTMLGATGGSKTSPVALSLRWPCVGWPEFQSEDQGWAKQGCLFRLLSFSIPRLFLYESSEF